MMFLFLGSPHGSCAGPVSKSFCDASRGRSRLRQNNDGLRGLQLHQHELVWEATKNFGESTRQQISIVRYSLHLSLYVHLPEIWLTFLIDFSRLEIRGCSSGAASDGDIEERGHWAGLQFGGRQRFAPGRQTAHHQENIYRQVFFSWSF